MSERMDYRMLCNVVNLSGDNRYDLSAVMGAIEQMQEESAAYRQCVASLPKRPIDGACETVWEDYGEECQQAVERMRPAAPTPLSASGASATGAPPEQP